VSATSIPARSFSSVVDSNGNKTTRGLTSDVARALLERDGPNATPDTTDHPMRNALAKFWAPVPWLLEASVVLEIVLHKYYEAGVIASLLVFNAALAYFQESRARQHWRL
jgi:H+-transporting ATPase